MASKKPVIVDFGRAGDRGPQALMQVKLGRLRGVHAIRVDDDGKPAHLGRATFTSHFMTKERPKGERRFSQAVVLDIHRPSSPAESEEAVRRFKKYKEDE